MKFTLKKNDAYYLKFSHICQVQSYNNRIIFFYLPMMLIPILVSVKRFINCIFINLVRKATLSDKSVNLLKFLNQPSNTLMKKKAQRGIHMKWLNADQRVHSKSENLI